MGEGFVEVALDFLDGAGADAPLFDQLVDPGIAKADHGELRRHKKGIRRHQQDHQNDPEEDQGDHGLGFYFNSLNDCLRDTGLSLQ